MCARCPITEPSCVSLDSQLEMWYLHGPDRSVPYEVTLKAVNDLYKEGKFKRFGISNYMAYVSHVFRAVQCLMRY